jgi:hypothetical protein
MSLIIASSTPTITAGAYTTGKALGGLLTFTGVAAGGTGLLKSIAVMDKANQKIAVDLLLFNQSFTATTDGSTIAISSADLLNMVGVITLVAGDYVSAAASTNAIATKYNIDLACDSLDNNLYGQLVIRGSATYASTSDIKVKVCVDALKGI